MKILHYTPKVQKQLGSKTKPEPWLHVAAIELQSGSNYVIYVWDTRQVIESGTSKQATNDINGTKANDNMQPLRGAASMTIFNEAFKNAAFVDANLSLALTRAINIAKATYQRELNQLPADYIIRCLRIDVVQHVDAQQLTDRLNKRVVADSKRRGIKSPNYYDLADVQKALRMQIDKWAK